MKKITLIVAMAQEAMPLIAYFDLQPCADFTSKATCRAFAGQYKGLDISLVINGTDPHFHVECVGTEPATLATYQALTHFQPDLLINAGTCGAFAEKGGEIGKVYIGERIRFFDHRIPMGDYEAYGNGNFLCPEAVTLAQKLSMPLATVCTGNSLDMSPTDAAILQQELVPVKEMEAAAIARVASLWGTPLITIKSITDLMDSNQTTAEEFMENLALASQNLKQSVITVLGQIAEESHATAL